MKTSETHKLTSGCSYSPNKIILCMRRVKKKQMETKKITDFSTAGEGLCHSRQDMSLPCTFNQQEETHGSHGQVGVKTKTNLTNPTKKRSEIENPFSKFKSRKNSRPKACWDGSRKPLNWLLKTEQSTQAC